MTCSDNNPPSFDESYGFNDFSDDLGDVMNNASNISDSLSPMKDWLGEIGRFFKGLAVIDSLFDVASDFNFYNGSRFAAIAAGGSVGASIGIGVAYGVAALAASALAAPTVVIATILGAGAIAGGILGSEELGKIFDENFSQYDPTPEALTTADEIASDSHRSTDGSGDAPTGGECEDGEQDEGDPEGDDPTGTGAGGTGSGDNPTGSGGGGAGGFADIIKNPPASPLVLDMDGDGIELINLFHSDAIFDLDADNFAELTGWVQNDDALLAIDRNGNGIIDDITELFGNATTDGFIELAELDTNNDGVIDAGDDQFDELLVWQDANENGISSAGELRTLAEAGITSINLNPTTINDVIAGHNVTTASTFVMNGQTHDVVDVWFEHSQTNSFYKLPDDFVYDLAVFDLPQLRGFGEAKDLWVAMTEDATLLSMVQNLVHADYSSFSFTDFSADVEAIMFQWAGVQNIDPTSRGAYIDGQVLEAIEAWEGFGYLNFNSPNPRPNAGELLTSEWVDFISSMATRFLVQIPMAPFFEAMNATTIAMKALEDSGTDLDTLTDAEINTLYNPVFVAANAAMDAHPLKDFKVLEYDFISNDFIGSFVELVDAIRDNEPSGSTDRGIYWNDLLPLINAVADTQGLSNAEYVAGLGGSYLDSITDDLTTIRFAQIVLGADGDDVLSGFSDNSYVVGNAGDDTIISSADEITYAYSIGDGNDFINSGLTLDDKLLFGEGITLADLTFTRQGNYSRKDDLLIEINGGGSILIDDQFNWGEKEIETIQFADASTLSAAEIRNLIITQNTTDGDDLILGYEDIQDTLEGGLGNDTIQGMGSSDTYIYNSGDGDDVILDNVSYKSSNNDVIIFNGINSQDVELTRDATNWNDLLVNFNNQSGSILIQDYFRNVSYGNTYYEIESFAFDDVTWTSSDVKALLLNPTSGDDLLQGYAGHDYIDGGEGNDTINGGGWGDDTLIGGAGDDLIDQRNESGILSGTDDLIYGGAGNDTLYGDYHNDTIYGGDGDDYIDGGSQNDSLIGGAGNDTLSGDLGLDTLDGGTGFDTADYGYSSADWTIDLAYKTAISGSTTEEVANFEAVITNRGDDILSGSNGDNYIEAGNDDDWVNGRDGNDTINGGSGSDTLYGGRHDDVIDGGSGNDTINAQWDNDTVHGGSGDDLLNGYTGNDIIYGDSGNDRLYGADGNDTLFGGSGSDILQGDNDDDILDGGAGADSLLGGYGGDIFMFSSLTDSKATARDRIYDFEVAIDKIDVSELGFTALETDGSTTEAGELRLAYSSASNRTYVKTDQSNFEFYIDGQFTGNSNVNNNITDADFIF